MISEDETGLTTLTAYSFYLGYDDADNHGISATLHKHTVALIQTNCLRLHSHAVYSVSTNKHLKHFLFLLATPAQFRAALGMLQMQIS